MSYAKPRVAVLRGGASAEYHESLASGAFILKHMPEEYHALDILVDKSGVWHLQGLPKSPERILSHVDLVWNVLHGDDNSRLIIASHGLPAIGGARIRESDLFAPPRQIIRAEEFSPSMAAYLFTNFPQPSVLRSLADRPSRRYKVESPQDAARILEELFAYADRVVAEEFIPGTHVTLASIPHFRGDDRYALPPLAFSRGRLTHEFLKPEEKKKILDMSRTIHAGGAPGAYWQDEFVLSPSRGLYFLGTDADPLLRDKVDIVHALSVVGASPEHFVDHVIHLALHR